MCRIVNGYRIEKGADLRKADLKNADLWWAFLQRADLRFADMRWVDLRGANLQEADMRWVDLRGADLREVDLRRTDLRGAPLDYSSGIPLWCGGQGFKITEIQAAQILAHAFSADCDSAEFCKLKKLAVEFCKKSPIVRENLDWLDL